MKLTFSTLGCPELDWAETCAMAKDTGFAGFEVRDLGEETFDYHAFRPENRDKIKAQMKQQGIVISCFSSDLALRDPALSERARMEIRNYIDLAAAMGTEFVRVLADESAQPVHDVDDEIVLGTLRELAPYAEAKGVTLLIETNGVYCDTSRLRDLLTNVKSDAVGALWDIHHPYRWGGETPEKTVQNLGSLIKYAHFKDSIADAGGAIKYKLMGEGDLPVGDAVNALRSIDFNGFISFEWLRRYSTDSEDSGVAFPHFVNYMTQFAGVDRQSSRLFENKSRTGYYIWEKETLIDLTFSQLLDRIADEFPDQYAFKYTTLDYTRTYSEFRADVDEFARALISLGVRHGDKVAIWATNVPAWFITFWAATRIGAVLVTVNTAYKIHEAEYLLRQSDTHTLVMIDGYRDSNYVDTIKKLCPELASHQPGDPLYTKRLPFLRNVITIDSEQPGCLTWHGALSYARRTPIEAVYRRAAAQDRHDVINMQYTSGTTGFPKGVMLTHYNVVNNGKTIGDRMDFSTADKLLIHVTMFHCFGMVLAMTAAVTHGATMCPIPAFSPKLSLACVNQEQITACHGVPTMFIAMLGHEDFAKTDFSYMRTGIMAGSPCPVKVMREVVEKMHMTEATIVFGQTESSPGCTMSSADDTEDVKVNTVGRALPGVECRIVDPVTGAELPNDTVGEFVARGYNIMKGYYKMPEATANAIDEDGWLHTGDLALRRPDGNFKITGRIKDMIIRGGENLYPKEIEDFLYTHPKVKDVQVIGVPDRAYGEEVMACIMLKDGETMTEDEVKEYVRSHMAKHKTPRYVRFVTEFPLNAAGKVMKYRMVEHWIKQLGLDKESKIETA
jgi:fatty-acyl-CoA synthase